jgi:hypothetical protein
MCQRWLKVFLCVLALGVMAWSVVSATGQVQAQSQKERLRLREISAPPAIKRTLASMRQEIQQKGLRYKVGYTKALDKPRTRLMGDVDDPKLTPAWRRAVNVRAAKLILMDQEAQAAALKLKPELKVKLPEFHLPVCSATYKAFNWRDLGKVTPIRIQDCGNCWAFAAAGAYEASYLRRNGITLDISEQYLNDCGRKDDGVDAGSCSGGLAAKALEHMAREGNVAETTVPYTGTNQACTNPATPLDALAWGFVDPAVEHPTTQQIKQAICTYGPVATRMRVVSGNFIAYTEGVYNEAVASDESGDGHAVLLVGWDDDRGAWLMKNSWEDWGEDGYCWIAYGSNRIGRHTSWVRAESVFYAMPMNYKLLQKALPIKKK